MLTCLSEWRLRAWIIFNRGVLYFCNWKGGGRSTEQVRNCRPSFHQLMRIIYWCLAGRFQRLRDIWIIHFHHSVLILGNCSSVHSKGLKRIKIWMVRPVCFISQTMYIPRCLTGGSDGIVSRPNMPVSTINHRSSPRDINHSHEMMKQKDFKISK